MHMEEKVYLFFEAIKLASSIYNEEKNDNDFLDNLKEIYGEDLSDLEKVLLEEFPRS